MATMRRIPRIAAVIGVAGAMLLAQRSFAYESSTPETRQVGATAVVYHGPAVNLALSYKSARVRPTGNWLFLDVVMSAARAPLELPRTAIAVRTPAGEVVPMATQQEFSRDYPLLAGALLGDRVAADPLGYLTPERPRRLDYFSGPAHHLVFASAWLDEWHNSFGRLFFELPAKVQPGRYELLMNLKEGQVTIPFTI